MQEKCGGIKKNVVESKIKCISATGRRIKEDKEE